MSKKKLFQIMAVLFIAILCGACSKKQANTETKGTKASMSEVKEAKAMSSEQDDYSSLNIDRKTKYFKRIKEIFDRDNGKMWGKKLEFRLMIVDDQTKELVANCQSKSKLFKPVGEVFIGKLPEKTVVSESSINYDGERWATVRTNALGGDENAIVDICCHELFHMNQPALNFVDKGYTNSQMEEMDARIYLKMEWEALEKAIVTQGDSKKEHIKAALAFRDARRKEFHHEKDENRFEIMEGLAEYTSDLLVYGTDGLTSMKIPELRGNAENEAMNPSFVRSFGYYSGIMYAVLLDEYSNDWRVGLKEDSNLGELLAKKAGIDQTNLSVDAVKNNYDYKKIYSYEKNRKKRQDEKKALMRDTLIKGKVLEVKQEGGMDFTFEPGETYILGDHGTVYTGFCSSGDWGTFKSSDVAVLAAPDYSSFRVNATSLKEDKNIIKGNGWRITLSDGYRLEKLSNGNYTVTKK